MEVYAEKNKHLKQNPMFRNREDAAIQLAQKLQKYKNQSGVILAVPRGAVPMGYYIARELGFPLDIVLTKKIGHPSNPEFAIGAVSTHGSVLTNYPGIPKVYIEEETKRIKKLLADRYKQYVGNRKPVELKGKTVIIVDDGIATGNTMRATIDFIKEHGFKLKTRKEEFIEPDLAEIAKSLASSNADKFLSDPIKFLEDFQKGIINPE